MVEKILRLVIEIKNEVFVDAKIRVNFDAVALKRFADKKNVVHLRII